LTGVRSVAGTTTLDRECTKTGRHDIAEILLKVALNTINQINATRLAINVARVLLSKCYNFWSKSTFKILLWSLIGGDTFN